MNGRNTALILVIIVLVVGVFAWEYRDSAWLAPLFGSSNSVSSQTQVGVASYMCDANKTIAATYYQGTSSSTPLAGQAPTPNGSVALVLSDGRSMTLPQTISASGIRYANADESVVFWSEGNTAFITEGTPSDSTDSPKSGSGQATQTYTNCVAVSNISGEESWNTFASSKLGYSVRYPAGYTVAPYSYQALGPGKSINGTQLTIPATEATGTNLSSDSYVSVETLPNAPAGVCTADLFLGDQVGSSTEVADNGVTYSMAKGGDAGAGNLYTEYVYAIPGSMPCTAVRYFIHSTQLGNYPAGTVTAFNQSALINEFDNIRRSLVLTGK